VESAAVQVADLAVRLMAAAGPPRRAVAPMAAVLAQARVQAVAWAPVAEAQVLAEGRSLLAEARVEELAARAVELAVELAAASR
jgi:hypothetical protein